MNAATSAFATRAHRASVCVDPDDAADSPGQRQCGLDDDVAAHRVADQDDVIEPEAIHDRGHVATEAGHRPGFAAVTRLAVAGEVDRDDPVPGAKARIWTAQYVRSHDQPWTKTSEGSPLPSIPYLIAMPSGDVMPTVISGNY